MNENHTKNELRMIVNASIPCLAISSPETQCIIDEIVKSACEQFTETPRILVWRVSIGFQEYAGYAKDDQNEEHEILTNVSGFAVDDISVRPTGVIEASDEDFPGCQVPFAVQFMTDYDGHNEGRRAIFVLRDWHNFIDSNTEHIDRQLNLFETILGGANKTVVMLNPSRWTSENVPKELDQFVRLINYPLPDKATRLTLVESIRHQFAYESDGMLRPQTIATFRNYNDKDIEIFTDACAGFTRNAIDDVLTLSLISNGRWDVSFILDEKRKNVERAGFTLVRPTTGFEQIGGLTPLKEWVTLISKRFTNSAKDYGFIRNIRGLLMAGVPGCGKTAIAKAAAKEMNMNILMVDATDLKGSLVGESEAKVHKLLEIAKAAAPLIVFVDEAEKLLGKSEGIHDGGAHDAVLGQFLTFMQEDDSGVFFVFTANNMNKFAPELIDRFEGRFFIDLPEPEEREEIIKIHLELRKQDASKFDIKELVRKTAKFSGRNIEDGIEEAMTRSFSEDRPLEMRDLVYVLEALVPTSKTKKDEIEVMRSFVDNGSMRRANNNSSIGKSGKTNDKNRRRNIVDDSSNQSDDVEVAELTELE